VGNETDEDDAPEELSDSLPPLSLDDPEEQGIDGADEAEIDDGPEDVGLDVETLDPAGDELDLPDDEEGGYALDDDKLDIEGELDDALDEDGWLDESEGAGSAWDDDALDDEDDDSDDDDGGLEGVEDPSLDDFVADDNETTLSIEGDDVNEEEDLERVELDLG
jgi:rRNA biogenesis protein RRP5